MTWMTRVTRPQSVHLDPNPGAGIRPRHLLLAAVLLAAGLALALLPLHWIVVAMPGLVVAGLAFVRPEIALYLLCFAIPFGSLVEVEIGSGITVGVTEGLIGLAAAAWLARTIAWRARATWPRLTVPLLLFVSAAGLSLLNVASLPNALKEMAKWVEFLVVLLVVANADGLHRATSSRPDGRSPIGDARQSQKLVACLLLAGTGQAALGAYQFLARSGPEFFAIGRFIRAYGTFEQPNPYAGYLGLTAPLSFALLLFARTRPSSKPFDRVYEPNVGGIPVWLKRLALVSFLATSAGIGMSASRGAWLAFGAALVASAAFLTVDGGRNQKGAAIFTIVIMSALLAGLVGGFRLLPGGITQRLTSFLPFVGAGDVRSIEVTDANYASLERLAFWRAALDMWRDHPMLGVGFGNYQIAYARYSLPKWRMALGHAHNYYLNIAAETGLIGLLAYSALWAAALWQTVRASLQARHPYAQALALGALGVLVHAHVHNVVDNLWVHNMYIHVAIVLGLVESRFIAAEQLGDAR